MGPNLIIYLNSVTDNYGGRGHDIDCRDEDANLNGGMIVIATSIPETREWIQWKGRTARHARPGPYLAVLPQQAEPSAPEPPAQPPSGGSR